MARLFHTGKLGIALRGVVALFAAAVALLAIGATESGTATDADSTAAKLITNTPCGVVTARNQATAALQVAGSRLQDSRGNPVDLYGISLVGGPQTSVWAATEAAAQAQITAAVRYWHANAIRLQVSEDALFERPTPGYGYNAPFAASVDRLVCAILAQHAIPVINDTTMFTGDSLNPTSKTVRFWQVMSRRYGNALPVVFDLFNEPRLGYLPDYLPQFAPDRVWSLWHWGGVARGLQYVGMQELVDVIRSQEGTENVIWVEPPYDASRVDRLPQHLLQGDNLVYAFHKEQPEERELPLGQIVDLARRGVPLVDGEWSQFAADDRPWECDPGAYAAVPRYLDALQRLSIGLIAWSLQPGALVAGATGHDTVHDGNDTRYATDAAALATPNVMRPGYGCDAASRGQGAGELIMRYFQRNSTELPAALFPTFG